MENMSFRQRRTKKKLLAGAFFLMLAERVSFILSAAPPVPGENYARTGKNAPKNAPKLIALKLPAPASRFLYENQ
ncbi:hypothetical protein IV454_28710 [Massilia antarctica]|uniref:Uncharacterized protein n=1 Tax=Massilia antarctica TaxID=2765360 RepID=A0AA49A817_9BURK|nr:hypothetical protein [Massilia antarctica]QPI49382.1 hypothetical protein IV454_28710 [Massilia antarctica]